MMDQAAQPLKVWREGKVGIIELAKPEKFNCLSVHIFEQMGKALEAFEDDPSVRVLLIQAQGKNFCTGAELDEVKEVRDNNQALRHFLATGHRVLQELEASRLPVVVAIQGLCLAGGMELMLAADVVYAAQGAKFGDQHAQFGLVPGWGGSQRLPRIVGLRRAMDLFLNVRWIDAATAESWGLVNYVVQDGEVQSAALDACHKMTERSGNGLNWMKKLAREGLDGTLQAGLKREEKKLFKLLKSDDVAEGLAAFEARRKPEFE